MAKTTILDRESRRRLQARLERNLEGRGGQMILNLLNIEDPEFDPEQAIRLLGQLEQMAADAKNAVRRIAEGNWS